MTKWLMVQAMVAAYLGINFLQGYQKNKKEKKALLFEIDKERLIKKCVYIYTHTHGREAIP